MTTEEIVAKLIGKAVAMYPTDVVRMLNSNGITIDAQHYNAGQLVDAVFNGLKKSEKFNTEFSHWLDSVSSTLKI